MTDDVGRGWFEHGDPTSRDQRRERIDAGSAERPEDWPTKAVAAGFATDRTDYYEKLHEATIDTAREIVREQELADDHQLIHAVRAMDDCERTANELAERLAEWAPTITGEDGTGIDYARVVAERDPETPAEERVVSLARQVVALADERDALREFVERRTQSVAPNLSALAGSILAAQLIALAGGLKPLARKPSGTVQVLGAEDALFAHLRGRATSPKHGIIYTHETVRTAPAGHRGSAARALAGKLSLAARVDHYSGERKPELDADLAERMERIHAREAER